MSKVKEYAVRPLKFDEKLVKQVMDRIAKDEPIAAIAKDLKIGAGKAAMAVMLGTEERKTIDDPAKLAAAIVKDRKAKASWGAAVRALRRDRGTCRAAFEAMTGKSFTTLDYRTKGASK